jgi:hypothetical protein
MILETGKKINSRGEAAFCEFLGENMADVRKGRA